MTDQTKPCDLPCTKCGSDDVLRRFWAKDDRRQAKEYGQPSGKWTRVIAWNEYSTRDHIVHHCRCCHYEWSTLPLKAVSARTRTLPPKNEAQVAMNIRGVGRGSGETALIAAMRAKVASHYGDEVPDV